MSANLLLPNQPKTVFLLIGLLKQLSKVSYHTLLMPSSVTITRSDSARNLDAFFDSSLTMSYHISFVSKSCFLSIPDLRRIRNTLDLTTAQSIATSLIHSKVNHYNSVVLDLPCSQLDRLLLILNFAAHAVSKTQRFTHIWPVLKSLHWLKSNDEFTTKSLNHQQNTPNS